MNGTESKLTRVGIFYDGNFFSHVSNYYNYNHPRQARISVSGLHEFVRHKVAEVEGAGARSCHIVDAHYFRGRRSAQEAADHQKLLGDRIFDDVLMREGIASHYLPLGPRGEKGIDVWLALEAFELAIYKRFNVLVLIACDSDYIPLVRKVNTLGTRVMVVGWDFEYTDHQTGAMRKTVTSVDLLAEVTYPVLMHTIIDDKTKQQDSLIKGLFVERREVMPPRTPQPARRTTAEAGPESIASGRTRGTVRTLCNGYGFISPETGGRDRYFYWSDLIDIDFHDLRVDDKVEFTPGMNERGDCAREVIRINGT
jgi:cold shock CspA family protein